MPLKFWEGSVPNTRAAWNCPSCGAPNTGPIPDGCVACGAGKDAQKASPMSHPLVAVPGDPAGRPSSSPFDAWLHEIFPHGIDSSHYEVAQQAWKAGAAWAITIIKREDVGAAVEQVAAPAGGYTVELVTPAHVHLPQDTRVQQTIVAALAFYRDNQLGYGPLPGQLGVEEVTKLIEQLSPKEEPA